MYGNEQMVIVTHHLHTSIAQFGSILSWICILASSIPIRQHRWSTVNFTMLKEQELFFIWHLYEEANIFKLQLASGCMWIWFADSIPALVGFLWALRFPPTPKNQNPFIFLVHSFWSLVVCKKPVVCRRFNYLCVRCSCHTAAPWEPSGLICRPLQKLQII